jgi:hypothetical protein
VNPDFGERQFEAAVNIELTSTLAPYMSPAIPIVPTTNQEAQEGWDALLKLGSGYWYFLQYKVAVYASRGTHWNARYWEVHGQPYFRFSLHNDSTGECTQHRLLTALRETQPGVYYCAPAFVKENELWSRAATQSVLDGSRLLDIADLALPNYSGAHGVSFDETGLVQVWSERGEQSRGERMPSIRRREQNRRQINQETVGSLLADAARIASSPRQARGGEALEAWFGARFPQTARGDWREITEGQLTEMLEPGELLATTSRILQLDFGLAWVIDPGQTDI